MQKSTFSESHFKKRSCNGQLVHRSDTRGPHFKSNHRHPKKCCGYILWNVISETWTLQSSTDTHINELRKKSIILWTLTYFVKGSITVLQLTSCLGGLDSAALLMFNQQQIYLDRQNPNQSNKSSAVKWPYEASERFFGFIVQCRFAAVSWSQPITSLLLVVSLHLRGLWLKMQFFGVDKIDGTVQD